MPKSESMSSAAVWLIQSTVGFWLLLMMSRMWQIFLNGQSQCDLTLHLDQSKSFSVWTFMHAYCNVCAISIKPQFYVSRIPDHWEPFEPSCYDAMNQLYLQIVLQITFENYIFHDGFTGFHNKNNWPEEEEGYNTEIQSIKNTHSLGLTIQWDTHLLD